MAMSQRGFRTLICCGLAWMLTALPLVAAEPAVVISVKSFNELLTDSQYLGNVIQQPLLGIALPGLVNQVTGGKGLKGLDVAKPIGAYLTMSSDGQPKDVIVFIPVSSQKTFAETLVALFPNPTTADGLTQYQSPQSPVPVFAKHGAKHFLFSISPDALKETSDPDKLVKSTADIALEFDLTKVSDGLKEQVLAQTEAAAAAGAGSNPSASDAERRGQEMGRAIVLAGYRRLLMDGDRLSVGITVDAKAKALSLDIGFTAKPNTALAQACASYAKTESPFASLTSKQTVGSLLLSTPLSKDAQDVFAMIVEEGEKGGVAAVKSDANLKETDRAAALEVITRLAGTLRQSIERGRLDQAIVVNVGTAGKLQVLAALKVVKGKELGKIFEDVIRKNPMNSPVKLGVSDVKGARIHAITLPPDSDREKHLGSGPAHLAFADDAVVVTAGEDSLTAAKGSLDTKATGKMTRAPISLRVGLAKLLPLAEDADPKILELGKSALENGRDEIALEVTSQPNGVKIRFEIQEGVLRLGGLIGTARAGQ